MAPGQISVQLQNQVLAIVITLHPAVLALLTHFQLELEQVSGQRSYFEGPLLNVHSLFMLEDRLECVLPLQLFIPDILFRFRCFSRALAFGDLHPVGEAGPSQIFFTFTFTFIFQFPPTVSVARFLVQNKQKSFQHFLDALLFIHSEALVSYQQFFVQLLQNTLVYILGANAKKELPQMVHQAKNLLASNLDFISAGGFK